MLWIILLIIAIVIIAVVVIILIARNNPANKYSGLEQADESRGKFIDSMSPEDRADYLRHEH